MPELQENPVHQLKPALRTENMAPAKNTEVYVDGASRGNPGESGIGVLVIREDGARREIRKYLGRGTNNEAEYGALIEALVHLSGEKSRDVRIHTDSQLVANQMNGNWKVKDPKLKTLHAKAKKLAAAIPGLKIRYIPRERNAEADRLANEAIDMYSQA